MAALGFGPGIALATTYKWVDDKGVVHYTDTVPPDAVNKGRVELNQQGLPVKKIDPAMTPEQQRQREAEQQQQREAVRQQQEAARRDRALLASYTTEADIDLAKKRSLRTVEAALQSAQAYSAQLSKKKSELTAKKVGYAGKAVPAEIESELAATDGELARQAELIEQKQKEIGAVTAKYDADKVRWHALQGSDVPGAPPSGGGAAGVAPTGAGKK